MQCTGCGKEVDVSSVFPGGTVRCACGVESTVPLISHPAAPATHAPYRAGGERTSEAAILTCPFCGGPCASDARACPHCNVELAAVRCPHCYALHFTGARFCARCGKELELEPLLDATDAPCPRCDKPLRLASAAVGEDAAADTGSMHECVGCGGLFLDNKTLDAIVAREADPKRRLASHPHVAPAASPHAGDPVRYVKCPLCHTPMNRVNFGRRSGVIVDVCKQHGTWFDSGELTRAIEFVAQGGLDETKRRDTEESARKEKEAQHAAAEMHAVLTREAYEDARSVGRWAGSKGSLLDVLFELLR